MAPRRPVRSGRARVGLSAHHEFPEPRSAPAKATGSCRARPTPWSASRRARWSGLGATQAMQDTLAFIWRTPKDRRRGFIRSRLRSTVGVIAGLDGRHRRHRRCLRPRRSAARHPGRRPGRCPDGVYVSPRLALFIYDRRFRPGSPSLHDVLPGRCSRRTAGSCCRRSVAMNYERHLRHADRVVTACSARDRIAVVAQPPTPKSARRCRGSFSVPRSPHRHSADR